MSFGYRFLMIFISVVIIKADYVRFNLDKASLTLCLETYFLKEPSFKSKHFSHYFADMIAEKFYDKSLPRVRFHKETQDTFYSIKNKKAHEYIDQVVMEQLKETLKKALEDCIERRNLPVFKHETSEMRDVLNYILVDWPVFLFTMIRTKNGRAELRAYVKAAIVSLMSALRSFDMNIDVFRHQLRRFWMLRALRYYDDSDSQFRYIRHIFTTDRDRTFSSTRLSDVHTRDDLALFVERSNQNFSLRNPPADRLDKKKILMIHNPGLLQQKDCIYTRYNLYDMTSAEFYFENHVDQFYRIIFFILELEMRGITDDASDIYDGPIPDRVMFNLAQQFVWDDSAYQRYLVYLREELDFTNGREEDFVRFFLKCIKKYKNVTAEVTTSTSTTRPWSTTSRDFQRNGKKGGVREKDHGKHFLPKRPRTCPENQGHQSFTNGGNNHFYGYVTSSNNFQDMVFPEESSALLKFLREAESHMQSLG